MTTKSYAGLSIAALLISAADSVLAVESSDLPTYRAVYRVEQEGKSRGVSEQSLSYDAQSGVYLFTSSLTVKGLLKLAIPKPIVERGEFRYDDGQIIPLEFSYDDGTRKGADNFTVSFDWERLEAATLTRGAQRESALHAGVLDRASIKAAVMRDMANGEELGPYLLADDEAFNVYEYVRSGEEALDTPAGRIDTETFVQQRPGSSRRLLLWVAPALDFLPVRMEQQKSGATDAVLILESVELNGVKRQ